MSQRHLDRLTPVDASFLHQESSVSHMHIGGLTIVEGPPPSMDEFLEQIRRRLHLVPRYRHKLAYTALDSGRPVWVDDPSFNLDYHVRHTALPAPGKWEQLQDLTARIFSQQLDRSKPLWEMWLIEGLEDDRFALITKTHHSLIDGIAGVDLATVLFDLSPDPPQTPITGRAWQPHPEPGTPHLLAAGLLGAVRAGVALAEGAIDALTHPERALARAREAAEGVGEIVWAGLNPAPETPLNVPIGPHRRFIGVTAQLEDFKLVKNAFGGTVNDVVLAVVAGALRTFLISRGRHTAGVEMRALVPVSVRSEGEHHHGGNRIVVMRGPLPIYISDPINRLRPELRAADDPRAGLAAELLHAPVQPDRHQRARPAVPAVRARTRDAARDPGGVPAGEPRAGDRDHVLQRPDELRAARRLRCASGHRRDRREHRLRTRDARRPLARAHRRTRLSSRRRRRPPFSLLPSWRLTVKPLSARFRAGETAANRERR
jgi:diacylglycerol O-acyltransferase